MEDMRGLIIDTATRIFRDKCDQQLVDRAEAGEWPAGLWQTLEEAGLTLAAVPEEQGGAGGSIGDGLALLKVAANSAAPLPLAETLLAGYLLGQAGATVPSGPLSVVSRGTVTHDGQGLHGSARAVPWAGRAQGLVVALEDGIALTEAGAGQVDEGVNMAGEPRDDLVFEGTPCQVFQCGDLRQELRLLGALSRAVMIAGALEAVLGMTVQYVQDRKQFGRPLAKFQAIQQSLAVMAGQTTAASSAASMAASAVEERGVAASAIEIAVAKARTGEAAGVVAELAHQAHGAIGFTQEYVLHQFTRRLWCWRDEYGGEPVWQAELGRQVARAGGEGLWEFVTRSGA